MSDEYLSFVKKRDGRIVPFDKQKISNAIFKAAKAVGGENIQLADELANKVVGLIEKRFGTDLPGIEEVQDIVEKVLIESGHAKTAKVFILYRDKRARARENLRVRKRVVDGKPDSTGLHLLVKPSSREELFAWDKSKIVEALVKEARLSKQLAEQVAANVEEKIFNSGLTQISTSLIRELVDNELFELGEEKKLAKQSLIGMPFYDLDQLIFSKTDENSNLSTNNPEAVNLAIAETILKQYALEKIFSEDVANAHLNALIHLHDLGYPVRAYCSAHSLEYIKKYGLDLVNLATSSAPAKHAQTLTGHLNTFLASMQAYYAGALGIGYVNIFYAPYVENMTEKEMKQEAQYLIFSCSQNAFSRGSQSLFIDFNIHLGVPNYLKEIPAIGPKGEYTGRTYGDYEIAAQRFAKVLFDVWREGDSEGKPFPFPKLDLHVDQNSFDDPEQFELLRYACGIASENGSTYFVFDRDEVSLSMCCRLKTRIDDQTMILHPESMRFCGFQNVTINLPQTAYKAGHGEIEKCIANIEGAMDLAMKAHIQKKEFVSKLMASPEKPLWQVGKKAADGRPYIDLDSSTYIIGMLGLNECVKYLSGEELHESEEAYKLGLRLVSAMYLKTKQLQAKHNLKVTLEESPAESASFRCATVDLRNYPQARYYVRGNLVSGEVYYSNSVHLAADAPVDILERIEKQGRFNNLIESGCITHVFLGEQKPSAESIFNLVKKTWENTGSAQITISPEFTVCRDCHSVSRGYMRPRQVIEA